MTSSSVTGCALMSQCPHYRAVLQGGLLSWRWCLTQCCLGYWIQLSWWWGHSRPPDGIQTHVHVHVEQGWRWRTETACVPRRGGLGRIQLPQGSFWLDGERQSQPALAPGCRDKGDSSRSVQLHGTRGSQTVGHAGRGIGEREERREEREGEERRGREGEGGKKREGRRGRERVLCATLRIKRLGALNKPSAPR